MARRPIAIAALWAALCVPSIALAQSDPPWTVGVGLGVANPLHGDFDFLAGTWTASLRAPLSERVLVDASVSQWEKTLTTVLIDVPLLGPFGPIGQVDRLTQERQHRVRNIAVSVLGTGGDAVRFTAGGGVGVFTYRRFFQQTLEGCVSATPSVCQDSRDVDDTGRVGVLALAEVASGRGRFRPFAQFRLDVPDFTDVGFASIAVVGGIHVVLR